jgi:hypothetical protein
MQTLDFRAFGLFKIIHCKERKSKGMMGVTSRMYHALLAFHKTTAVPIVHSNFQRAGFVLDLDNIRNPVQIDPNSSGWNLCSLFRTG